jgi:hypothetical protein
MEDEFSGFYIFRMDGRNNELQVWLKQKILVQIGEVKYVFNQIVMRGGLRSSQIRFITEQLVPVYRKNEEWFQGKSENYRGRIIIDEICNSNLISLKKFEKNLIFWTLVP